MYFFIIGLPLLIYLHCLKKSQSDVKPFLCCACICDVMIVSDNNLRQRILLICRKRGLVDETGELDKETVHDTRYMGEFDRATVEIGESMTDSQDRGRV